MSKVLIDMTSEKLERKLKLERVEACLNCEKFLKCENIGKFVDCESFIEVENETWTIKKT